MSFNLSSCHFSEQITLSIIVSEFYGFFLASLLMFLQNYSTESEFFFLISQTSGHFDKLAHSFIKTYLCYVCPVPETLGR